MSVSWINMRTWLPGPWQVDVELQDDEWTREKEPIATVEPEFEELLATGEAERDSIGSGVSEVHWAPLQPQWTTVPPTTPGIWWVRVPGAARKVAEVFRAKDGKLRMRWTDYGPFLIPRVGLEWSDRAITVPLETRG